MEFNTSDETTLDPIVNSALRAYLPLHFPQLRLGKREESAIKSSTTAAHHSDACDNNSSSSGSGNDNDRCNGPKVEAEWIGIMGFTPDRNPLVGRLLVRPGEFIAAGYTGHGMPVAFLAGKHIADMICGVESEIPLPAAYAPSRFGL